MSKKIFIIIGLVIFIGGAVLFLATRKEDPQVLQAKEEIRQAEAVVLGYQNTVNAIPSLKLSEDVKNDFKMEAGFFGVIGKLEPGVEGLGPEAAISAGKLITAANARSSSKISVNLDQDFGKFMEEVMKVSDVAAEDLGILEILANTFDEQVKQAKLNVPQLLPLSVARNKKTEKYFLEFERLDQRLKALAASLGQYSSTELRQRIKKLKPANEFFGQLSQGAKLMVEGKVWFYSLNIAKEFPEVRETEDAVKACYKLPTPAGCKQVGPFPTDKYQLLLRELETIYSGLIED